MARPWPLGCGVEVPHANPTYMSMDMTARGSGISMVESQASKKKSSGSILSLCTDEQKEPIELNMSMGFNTMGFNHRTVQNVL